MWFRRGVVDITLMISRRGAGGWGGDWLAGVESARRSNPRRSYRRTAEWTYRTRGPAAVARSALAQWGAGLHNNELRSLHGINTSLEAVCVKSRPVLEATPATRGRQNPSDDQQRTAFKLEQFENLANRIFSEHSNRRVDSKTN